MTYIFVGSYMYSDHPSVEFIGALLEGAGDVISRAISALTGATLIITLLITNLPSPLPLQVQSSRFFEVQGNPPYHLSLARSRLQDRFRALGFRVLGFRGLGF